MRSSYRLKVLEAKVKSIMGQEMYSKIVSAQFFLYEKKFYYSHLRPKGNLLA